MVLAAAQVGDAQFTDGPVFDQDQYVKSRLWPFYLNASVDAEFRKFIEKQTEQEGITLPLAFCSLWIMPTLLRLSMVSIRGTKGLTSFFIASLVILFGAMILIVVYFVAYFTRSLCSGKNELQSTLTHRYVLRIGIIAFNIGNALNLLARSLKGSCDDINKTEYDCTPFNALPTLHVISVVMSSFCVYFLHKLLTYRLVTLNTVCTCCCMVAAASRSSEGASDSRFTLSVLFSYLIFFFVTHAMAYQNMTNFEYYMQLREFRYAEIKSTKELAWRERENMRMVLANVAHDLKTPLQAFTAGVHTSRSILTNASGSKPTYLPRDKRYTSSGDSSGDEIATSLATTTIATSSSSDFEPCVALPIGQCDALGAVFREMDASCAFMTMQINRALDVSRNDSCLKLVAKYEPVAVPELVQWTESIMNCIQNRVRVHVQYKSCFFNKIITDKVWFQENLLCLLSNAVKFSPSDASVVVSLEVQYMDGTAPDGDGNSSGGTVTGGGVGAGSGGVCSDSVTTSQRGRSNSGTSVDSHSVTSCSVASVSEIHPEALAATTGMVGGYLVRESKLRLMVEVADNGIGVPEDRLECLFKPFSQTQRRAGGTGLGLYSLALRVQALGGSYGMRPNTGRDGSIFYFWIPMHEDNAPDDAILETSAKAIRGDQRRSGFGGRQQTSPSRDVPDAFAHITGKPIPNAASSSRRHEALGGPAPMVLVVDDSLTSLKTVQRALTQSGSLVQTASDGFTALKLMKTTLYSVVIMDIQMPIMDGLESVRQLRAWEKGADGDGRHQYVIGATACLDDGTRQEALEVGMDEIVGKPFVFSDIINRLHVVHSQV